MTKRIFAILLALLTVFAVIACDKSETPNGDGKETENNAPSEGSSVNTDDQYLDTYNPEATADSYVEPTDVTYDFGGHEFKFLNSAPVHSMYVYLDPEASGDILDEACALRNLMAEEKFNIKITEETQPFAELADYAMTLIQSGEDVYDAMYIGCGELTPMISENLFVDLMDIEEINIDKIWWDQPLVQKNIIDGRLFYATSDLHLMAFEGIWTMYFSEGRMNELGLDFPYQLVTDGKWTLEALNKYTSEGANLNGDTSFKFDASGNALYGEVSAQGFTGYRLYGFGTEYVKRNEEGRYEFTADRDTRFTDVWTKAIEYLGSNDGRFIYGKNEDMDDGGYFKIFMEDRAMFLSAELKGATILREWEGTFGLLPQPKFDETQENYASAVYGNVLSFCIPNTNKELERTGIIADYLTYESYTSLLPRYYDIHVGLKALSREESKQSLEIIRNSRGMDADAAYKWTSDLRSNLIELAKTGNIEIASVIEKYREASIAAIDKTYSEYPSLPSAG